MGYAKVVNNGGYAGGAYPFNGTASDIWSNSLGTYKIEFGGQNNAATIDAGDGLSITDALTALKGSQNVFQYAPSLTQQ